MGALSSVKSLNCLKLCHSRTKVLKKGWKPSPSASAQTNQMTICLQFGHSLGFEKLASQKRGAQICSLLPNDWLKYLVQTTKHKWYYSKNSLLRSVHLAW